MFYWYRESEGETGPGYPEVPPIVATSTQRRIFRVGYLTSDNQALEVCDAVDV